MTKNQELTIALKRRRTKKRDTHTLNEAAIPKETTYEDMLAWISACEKMLAYYQAPFVPMKHCPFCDLHAELYQCPCTHQSCIWHWFTDMSCEDYMETYFPGCGISVMRDEPDLYPDWRRHRIDTLQQWITQLYAYLKQL